MLITGNWWLHKWHKFHRKGYEPFFEGVFDEDILESHRAVGFTAGFLYAAMTAVSPAFVLAASPYHALYSASSELSLGWRTAMRAEGGYLAHSTSVSRWILGGTDDILNVRYRRLLLAKAGSRLIPGIGWALLAVDVYHLSKWYLETDF